MTKNNLILALLISTCFVLQGCSNEDCILVVNSTDSDLELYRSYGDNPDTNMLIISPRETLCIGNWESFFGKIQMKNRSNEIINEKYDYLKISNPNIIDLLSITPKYEVDGNENHYLFFIE
ncbi:MAG: hypothetical protein CVU05_03915 [Bacteroidetes bacterium HGW-Bacteroidetes-21]|jgi:hypothetical protein|nr:MAG: hypothetical protein CVU05_03915 [Bacteroidetes bacterium HGW-Bacteroidetes-21]